MTDTTVLKQKQNRYLQIVHSFDDILKGNTYAMLGEQVMLFENEKGEYVLFTIDPLATYSKKDFMQLPEGAPFELQNGKLIYIASPKTLHQLILGNIFNYLFFFVKQQKLGKVFSSPMDVHFDEKNIVQPDILFVSKERNAIIKDWIFGAPDLAVEIFSPSTKRNDKKNKFNLYQKHGVLEYWLVDTELKTVEVHVLKEKKYALKGIYKAGDSLKSNVVKGFEMAVVELFEKAD